MTHSRVVLLGFAVNALRSPALGLLNAFTSTTKTFGAL